MGSRLPERLTAREFLSLVGVRGKGNNYRRAIVWLAMAAVGDDNDRIPDVLKEPFGTGCYVSTLFTQEPEPGACRVPHSCKRPDR